LPVRVAVLITCHNRKDVTLACLNGLFRQELPEDIELNVFLVDDGSSDGTGDAVKQRFPSVNVIRGDGSLYWCGGMRLAWDAAVQQDHDYYLWLNDDTMLFDDALSTLLDADNAAKGSRGTSKGIIVGSTVHAETGAHTYGGFIQAKEKSLNFRPVVPSGSPEPCDTFNGNCVLVSRGAFLELGNLSPEFSHSMGDTDYGLRAKEKAIPMFVAPKYTGRCSGNPTPSWLDNALPLRERIKILDSPKGLPPKEWRTFCRRHMGWKWVFKVVKLYLRVLSPDAWEKMKRIAFRP